MISSISTALFLPTEAESDGRDATALIGTLVLVYTFFVAAYGVLVPLIIGLPAGRRHDLALVILLLAIELDLYRVINSVDDLYRTTVGGLSGHRIHDAAAEFGIYFFVNVLVLFVLLVVVFWPPSPAIPVSLQSEAPDPPR